MKILPGCEESQAVCLKVRNIGNEAYSADILECSGPRPDWHIKGDILEIIEKGWDMMIAFPTCTYLAVSGARHFQKKKLDGRQQQGIDFFMKMIKANIPKIAVENPIGIISSYYRKPNQIIQPYYFGDSYSKPTCLWLKGLDPLRYNKKIKNGQYEIQEPDLPKEVDKGDFVTFSSGKRMEALYNKASGTGNLRSKTFPGIAKAMANQWG